MSDPEQKLLAGIREDAHQGAEKIVERARTAADNRETAASQQVERITNEAEKRAREQIDTIQRACEANIAVATRRISLRIRNDLIQAVLEMVQEEFKKMVKLPEYRRILCGWIVEAVLGLGASATEGSSTEGATAEGAAAEGAAAKVNVSKGSSAVVNASKPELPLIDSKLLREAESKVKELCGRTVTLSKSAGDPLSAQGVVVTSRDGRRAFNNQVRTRLLRSQTEISRLIHNLDSNNKPGGRLK